MKVSKEMIIEDIIHDSLSLDCDKPDGVTLYTGTGCVHIKTHEINDVIEALKKIKEFAEGLEE